MKIFFLTSRLDLEHGGLTASLLNKVRILFNEKKISSNVVSFHYDENYEETIKLLRERYNIPEQINFININNFFAEYDNNEFYQEYAVNRQGMNGVKKSDSVDYYQNGMLKMNVSFGKITYFDEQGIITKKDIINKDGYLFSTNYYDRQSNLIKQLMFKKNGYCYATKNYVNSKLSNIIYFKTNSSTGEEFSENEYKELFLKKIIDHDNVNILVSETRAQDKFVLDLNEKNIKKIFMTHSIHIRPETDIVRVGNREVLNNLNYTDGVVFLTNSQKRDVENRFGNRDNYFVIPHSIERKDIIESKEKNTFVILSRLDKNKRIDNAIVAFKNVVKHTPDSMLFIYGEGADKDNLSNLIKEHQLEKNVFLKGYTESADKVLQRATCTIFPSEFEGFGLSVLESLSNGTPVIAYDIKYGPSDMIIDGENGYLIENGSTDKLSSAIINYIDLSDIEKNKMCENALQSALNFSDQRFAEKWKSLFNSVKNNSLWNISEVDFVLEDLRWLAPDILQITTNIESSSDISNYNIEGRLYLRSSLETKENNKYILVKDSVKKKNNQSVQLETVINFKDGNLDEQEIYDYSIVINKSNFFFKERIGNKRNHSIEIKDKRKKHRTWLPYFTNPYGNLSFKYFK